MLFVTLGKEDEQAAKELIPYIEALCIDFLVMPNLR